MSDTFTRKSRDIANDFIQSVVFLDDKAYNGKDNENPNHDFDALKISQVFAKENKICAVYKPESDSDIDNFKNIAEKADAVILDWQIIYQQNLEPGTEEEDAPDDPRGLYTKDIIKSILFGAGASVNSLKIIVIYTGDYTMLESITDDIYTNVFQSSHRFQCNRESYSIESETIKVLIRAKKVEVANDVNRPKYQSKMVAYEELPSFVLEEFTKITSGLLPNFALVSLTALRRNSSKIIGLFSKEMDSAYLSHKSLLPNQEDAEDLLVELFGDSISDLLFYNKSGEFLRSLIEDWIDTNIVEQTRSLLKKDGSKHTSGDSYSRNRKLLIDLLTSLNKDVEKRYIEAFHGLGVSKNKAEEYFKHIAQNNTALFLNTEDGVKSQNIDQLFSILSHHKSLFLPNSVTPKLTLGTVLKSTVNEDQYYVCIQQRCDSTRIAKDTDRKFLFIPLVVSQGRFDILTPEGVRLKKVKDSFSIRTIKFVCTNEKGIVFAEENDGKRFIFRQKYNSSADEQFEWVFDLKDLHSQRFIAEYTSQLSRIGLNESEWHRRFLS